MKYKQPSKFFCTRLVSFVLVATLAFTLLPLSKNNAVLADHEPYPFADGIYRIPYADGVDMRVGRDHHTHTPVDRYDLNVGFGTEIAAAASGWIRAIVDNNGNSPGAGDGVDINGAPQDDSAEHSCGNNPSAVVGNCSDYNNYVWIEHPNGEYTKYTHFGTGTVTALGWTADPDNMDVGAPNWVNAGEVLGLEGDVGQATNSNGVDPAPHLHWEVAAPNNPGDDLTWNTLGGGITNGDNFVPTICDIGDNGLFDAGEEFTAAPCTNTPPTADAGGPYVVNEGSSILLDGTGSSDPDGLPLYYLWSPDTDLDDPKSAMPTHSGVDDAVIAIRLDVFDQVEQIDANASTTVTVLNVAPTVNALGDTINEGQTATISAQITDPGVLDTHTVSIDWDDGTAAQAVTPAQLAVGVNHVYGDNGTYNVVVTVTDDDGGVGDDTATVVVTNLDPTASLDTSGEVTFPGGDYMVVEAGAELPASADATDPGSDDLTFSWSTGDVNTYFNNGVSTDQQKSPLGTFPFMASDSVDALYAAPGVETLGLTVTDDDGGSDDASSNVIVTGTADDPQGSGWWKHQYSGNGSPQIDAATALGYLEIVNAASSVFSETTTVATMADVHRVLSPKGGDRRARARAELMLAWLQFASGAIAYDDTIQLQSGSIGFLPLMFNAEAVINNPASTNAQLMAVEKDLSRTHPNN